MGGALLIYLEFNRPGTIVPGALGTLMVLLGDFWLESVADPIYRGVVIGGGNGLLLLEAKFGGHGALAIAGIVCLTSEC